MSKPPKMSTDSVAAWIRGFTRGLTNDPPSNGPDPMFDSDFGGDYTVGQRLGTRLRGDRVDLDLSGLLVIEGNDGAEVSIVPDGIDPEDVQMYTRSLGTAPLQAKVPTGWSTLKISRDGQVVRTVPFYTDPKVKTTITASGELQQLHTA